MMFGMSLEMSLDASAKRRARKRLRTLGQRFDEARSTRRRVRIAGDLIQLGPPGIEQLCDRVMTGRVAVGEEILGVLAAHAVHVEPILFELFEATQDRGAARALEVIEMRRARRMRARRSTEPPAAVGEANGENRRVA
jgi:hypothetical protein